MAIIPTTCIKFCESASFSFLILVIFSSTFLLQCVFGEQSGGGLLLCGAGSGKTLWSAASLPADGGRRVRAVPQWPALWKGEVLSEWGDVVFFLSLSHSRRGQEIMSLNTTPGEYLQTVIPFPRVQEHCGYTATTSLRTSYTSLRKGWPFLEPFNQYILVNDK